MSFDPQKDLYFVQGSIYHHAQWDKLFEMGERFLTAEEGEFCGNSEQFVCGWEAYLFPPSVRFKKREIHTVFRRFLNLRLGKNLSLPALAELFRAS